jgi:NADH-quinone oxidoreductase subunit M
MLFLLVGVVYDRAHHRNIDGFGGLLDKMPKYGALTALAFMASLGLPGLAGFPAEILNLIGGFLAGGTGNDYVLGIEWLKAAWFYRVLTALSVSGVVFGAGYFLWSYQKVFLGPLNPKYENIEDVDFREKITLWPLAILVVLFGILPWLYTIMVTPACEWLMVHVNMPWAQGK